MRRSSVLSPRDLARALGVSESSVKRWVDAGRLDSERTAGGHRRVRLAEAVRFVRSSGLEVVRPDLLRLGTAAPSRRRAARPSSESLVEALRRGDDFTARRMLVGSFLQGSSAASLCDGPIRSALEELGHLWREGPSGIALEHHAVDTCVQALMEIRATIEVPQRSPHAAGGAVEGDPYILPSLMAAVVLAEAGFRTLNLGPNVPAKALLAAVEAHSSGLVWRSASIEMAPAALRADVASIQAGAPAAAIVAGGRGLARGSLEAIASVHHFDSMTELAGFARGLKSSPSIRRVVR